MDELIILDIKATIEGRRPNFQVVRELTSDCFMPVTVGGGVRSTEDVRELLANGADKVAICTAAIETPELIYESATRFGSQAIVVGIDADGRGISGRCGSSHCGDSPVDWARRCERLRAGEILLNNVQRDGCLQGYDCDAIGDVAGATDIPVIAVGGCGAYEHMADAFRAGAHAVAVGAAFQFRDMTPKGAARHLHERGFAVRL